MYDGAGHAFLNFGNAERYRPKQAARRVGKDARVPRPPARSTRPANEGATAPHGIQSDRAVEDDPPSAAVGEAGTRGVQTDAAQWCQPRCRRRESPTIGWPSAASCDRICPRRPVVSVSSSSVSVSEPREDPVARDRLPSRLARRARRTRDRGPRAGVRPACPPVADPPSTRATYALGLARLELPPAASPSRPGPREHDQAEVSRSRRCTTKIRPAPRAVQPVAQQAIGGPLALALGAGRQQPRRLIDHQEIVVLVHEPQERGKGRRGRDAQLDSDPVAPTADVATAGRPHR